MRRRHAEFFLDVAEAANLNPNTYDPTKSIRHDIVQQEQNEVYGALAWALDSGSVALGLRLASSVGGWLWSINYPQEGVRYFDRLLEKAVIDAVPPEILADALREYGAQAHLSGDNQKAEGLTQQSLALYEQLGDEHGRAVMLHRLGAVALAAGDLDRAHALVEESHAIHQRRNDQWGVSQTLGALGAIAREAGDETLAYELIGQSAAIARDIGGGFSDWWASGMLAELGCLSLNAGRLDEAETHAHQALTLADQLHYRAGRVFGVGVLAATAAARGQPERAARLWAAIEDEDAVAPLGGWRRHRQACEALIRQASGPDFERGRAEGHRFTLDDAVALALDDVG